MFPVVLFNFSSLFSFSPPAAVLRAAQQLLMAAGLLPDRLLEETTACRLLLLLLWCELYVDSLCWTQLMDMLHTFAAAVAVMAPCVPHSSDIQHFPPSLWKAQRDAALSRSSFRLHEWAAVMSHSNNTVDVPVDHRVCSSTEYSVNIHISLGGGKLDILTSIFECRVSRCSLTLWLMFLWSVGPVGSGSCGSVQIHEDTKSFCAVCCSCADVAAAHSLMTVMYVCVVLISCSGSGVSDGRVSLHFLETVIYNLTVEECLSSFSDILWVE